MGVWNVVLGLVGLIFLGYEGIRFVELHRHCLQTQAQNIVLLQDVACSNPWERTLRGAKQEALCAAAELENSRTPLACAWQHMWTQGELHQFWTRVTTSYWLLFGLGAPALCTAVMMWFSNRNQAAARRDQREMFENLTKTLSSMQLQPNPGFYEEKRHRRKHKSPPPSLTSHPSWNQHHESSYVQLVNV